ncbi:MAG: hypothetical protein ACFFE4_06605 [Candidatus Thorarchaeota archaeon]
MGKPTKEDASLIVQIFGIGANDEKFQIASNWFTLEMNETNYDDFKQKYPPGSDGYTNFMKISSYGELIGVLVNREALNEDLVFEMWGDMMWDKLKPIVYGLRKDLGIPRFLENFEAFVIRYPKWVENNPVKV